MRRGLWCSCIRWALCRTRTGRTWCFPLPTSSSRRTRCERASFISRWRGTTAPCPRWWGGFFWQRRSCGFARGPSGLSCAWRSRMFLRANVRKAARALRRGRLREARTSGSGLPLALRTKAARVLRMGPSRTVSSLRIPLSCPKAPTPSARRFLGALPFGPRATRLPPCSVRSRSTWAFSRFPSRHPF